MTRRAPKPRSPWRTIAAVLAGVTVSVIVFRIASVRSATGRLSVDTGCHSDPNTVADMSRFTAGAAQIRCEPWDIGTGVTGYVWRAPKPRAVLLLQPAWGDYAQRHVSGGSWLIPQLLSRGITVYAFDMWGNGRSPGARGATDIRRAVSDHLTARRALRDQPLPIFVLGHSVGGLVTVTSALDDQTGLHGMILLAPTLEWGVGGFMRLVARVGSFVAPSLPVPGPGGDEQTRDPEARRRMNADSLMNHGPISWISASTGLTLSRVNRARYHELRVPILVLHGSADRAPDPSGSRDFIGLVASPDKALSIIPDGLHALLDDSAGADVVQLILSWLDRRS